MGDVSRIIVPKSDQLNADDLISGPRTITIRSVDVKSTGGEQPVTVRFDGDDGKPWKPCKTMTRLMAQMWKTPETANWVGKSVTLYHDPKVKWAGAEVGGIRISAMSHIGEATTVATSDSRGSRVLRKIGVLPNAQQEAPRSDRATSWANDFMSTVGGAPDLPSLEGYIASKAAKLDELKAKRPELHADCHAAMEARRNFLELHAMGSDDFSDDEDPFAGNEGAVGEGE